MHPLRAPNHAFSPWFGITSVLHRCCHRCPHRLWRTGFNVAHFPHYRTHTTVGHTRRAFHCCLASTVHNVRVTCTCPIQCPLCFHHHTTTPTPALTPCVLSKHAGCGMDNLRLRRPGIGQHCACLCLLVWRHTLLTSRCRCSSTCHPPAPMCFKNVREISLGVMSQPQQPQATNKEE